MPDLYAPSRFGVLGPINLVPNLHARSRVSFRAMKMQNIKKVFFALSNLKIQYSQCTNVFICHKMLKIRISIEEVSSYIFILYFFSFTFYCKQSFRSVNAPDFFCNKIILFLVVGFHPNMPHTHHDAQRSPHDFSFPNFGSVWIGVTRCTKKKLYLINFSISILILNLSRQMRYCWNRHHF